MKQQRTSAFHQQDPRSPERSVLERKRKKRVTCFEKEEVVGKKVPPYSAEEAPFNLFALSINNLNDSSTSTAFSELLALKSSTSIFASSRSIFSNVCQSATRGAVNPVPTNEMQLRLLISSMRPGGTSNVVSNSSIFKNLDILDEFKVDSDGAVVRRGSKLERRDCGVPEWEASCSASTTMFWPSKRCVLEGDDVASGVLFIMSEATVTLR